ncbi:MAG: hypothetical protein K940chlam9_00511 [Chlamydiae bacterium]|nr:hypothetical protein [Chlamydiota bacterium]
MEIDPYQLEQAYQHYIHDLPGSIPDGIIEIELTHLEELGLLLDNAPYSKNESLTHNFYVIESEEKLTLFNHKFSVWITPQMVQDVPTTYTLIALNDEEFPRLEMVFTTQGTYNQSSMVLRILEKYLEQIEENEREIYRIRNMR